VALFSGRGVIAVMASLFYHLLVLYALVKTQLYYSYCSVQNFLFSTSGSAL